MASGEPVVYHDPFVSDPIRPGDKVAYKAGRGKSYGTVRDINFKTSVATVETPTGKLVFRHCSKLTPIVE